MKNNELLESFANNKKILFLAPHLIYISGLLSRYYLNQEILFFKNILVVFLLFFLITLIVSVILKKIIKNNQFVFVFLFVISFIYLCKFNLLLLLFFVVDGIILTFCLSKIGKDKRDMSISILLFIIFAYFICIVPRNVYLIISNGINIKHYNEEIKINVDDETNTPNIYWIHADAMMNFQDVNKYFHYYNVDFVNYLKNEGYYFNENASLISGHKTQKALAAMLNPNYYDNFFVTYLDELNDVYLEKRKSTSFNVSNEDLVDKRFNNELMLALLKKDYTTVGISKFNSYSSLKTDVLFDYYNFTDGHWHFTENKDLRKMSNDSITKIESIYNIYQLKEILSYSVLSPLTENFIPYEYDLLDYNIIDTSNYSYINKTKYWQIKAILKSIEQSNFIDGNKFVFIDYDLNHTALSFDEEGNVLHSTNYMNLYSYVGNYIYSCKLLMEMLDYIKVNDPDSIIIVQADHGLHTFEDDFLMKNLNISREQLEEIRNSVMNAVYVPEKYRNGDEIYLNNPLNISRYLINNFVGDNYDYLSD